MTAVPAVRAGIAAAVLLLAAQLHGCAANPSPSHPSAPADAEPRVIELAGVPFHPQTRWQCGPAALATVLQWNGVDVAPADLVAQVYVPARRGSLQPEMLASTRSHGLVPYRLAPEWAAILAEVEAGQPVLVLQNLAFSWMPLWHYAVVVGFDGVRGEVILRSGETERRRMPLPLFERTWRRGGSWGFVAADPGRPPAGAEELEWLRAVLELERGGHREAAGRGWEAATRRWPESAGAWMGSGNHRFSQGDYPGAAEAFRQVLELRPGYPPALNNLAHALAGTGDYAAAEASAAQALAAEPDNPLYASTLSMILSRNTLSPSGDRSEID